MKPHRWVKTTLMAVSLTLAAGCGESGSEDGSSDGVTGVTLSGTSSPGTDTNADTADSMASDETDSGMDTTGTTTDTTTTSGGGDCADYRMTYPEGPYGITAGSVLQEFPGMVFADGTMTGLGDIYADKSKVALLLLQAFDT